MPVPAMASLMSSPEQNPLPAPVSTTQRTSRLRSASVRWSVSSSSIRDRDGVAAVRAVERERGDVVVDLVEAPQAAGGVFGHGR